MIKLLLVKLFPAGLTGSALGFAASTLIKVLGGFVVIKLIAMFLGPQGLGHLGQLMSFVMVVILFAGGGITNALIQSLAAAPSIIERQRCLAAGIKICVAEILLAAVMLIVFASHLAQLLLHDASMAHIFYLLAATQALAGAGNILLAVFSVMKRIRIIVLANILGTIIGVITFSILIYQGAAMGAAYGLVVFPAVSALILLVASFASMPADWRVLSWSTRHKDMQAFYSYVLIMLVMASALPLTQMLVRDMVGNRYGWLEVGYWQGMLKISEGYMQFIGMMLVYYMLPRLSANRQRSSLDKEFSAMRLPLMAGLACGLLVVFVLRDFIVQLLFTEEFYSTRDYFMPQALTDLLRTFAMMYVYYALSRGARLVPVLFELMQAACMLVFAVLLLPRLQGLTPVYAQLASSALTLVFMGAVHMGITRRRFFAEGAA